MNQGQGGWPMTVFLTPDQEPFFAGTYFPPDRPLRPARLPHPARRASPTCGSTDRAGAPRRRRAELAQLPARERAARARRRPWATAELAGGAGPARARLRRALGRLRRRAQVPALRRRSSLLLRCHRRSGDARGAAPWSRRRWTTMARGGMYDQVGGGFHRYSVDERWLVPHFEKMLYDNALLARAYLEALPGHRATRSTARIAARDPRLRPARDDRRPRAASTPPPTPTARAKRASSSSGRRRRSREALGDAEAARRFCAVLRRHGGRELRRARASPTLPRPLRRRRGASWA